MRADEILKHVRKQPFVPFQVFVSDGATYPVRHPEMILVTRSEVIIAINANGGIPEESVYCGPVHITRIKPLRNGAHQRRRKS